MNDKYKYFILIFLTVASFIAFGRIIGNDFVNYDDNRLITENSYIQSGFTTESIKWAFTNSSLEYWHPLTWLSIILNWSIFGDNASGHHFVNLLLHIGSVLFLFLFLNKATKNLWPSAFAAAFFALHPLRVESVAWAAEHKDVLSMFFGAATLYAYASYVEKPRMSKYFNCLILFVLSLMSKPMLVTLPCIMLLLDYWPLERWQKRSAPVNIPAASDRKNGGKNKRPDAGPMKEQKNVFLPGIMSFPGGNLLWEKVPFFLLSIVLGIMIIVQLRADQYLSSLQHIQFSDRIVTALVSYVAYLVKTLWPANLAVFYPYEYSLPLWKVVGSAAVLLLISVAAACMVKRAPFLLIGWLWYLGALFPVSGLLQTGAQSMADRYSYLPAIGIAVMLAWGVRYLLTKKKSRKKVLFSAAGIVLTVLTILTWRQCGHWKNSISLFGHALQVTTNNYLAHDSLGVALDAEGRHQEALEHYKEAISINPDYAHAYYNLAGAMIDQKNFEEAEKYLRKTIALNPRFANAHNKLGIILEMYHKKYGEAIYHYEEELKLQPNNYGVHYNIGIALAQTGRREEAIEHFRTATRLNPNCPDGVKELGLSSESLR